MLISSIVHVSSELTAPSKVIWNVQDTLKCFTVVRHDLCFRLLQLLVGWMYLMHTWNQRFWFHFFQMISYVVHTYLNHPVKWFCKSVQLKRATRPDLKAHNCSETKHQSKGIAADVYLWIKSQLDWRMNIHLCSILKVYSPRTTQLATSFLDLLK